MKASGLSLMKNRKRISRIDNVTGFDGYVTGFARDFVVSLVRKSLRINGLQERHGNHGNLGPLSKLVQVGRGGGEREREKR
jgi:hypothetical protein